MLGRRLTWLPLFAVVPAALLVAQVHFTCGLVYSLDDAYIHLALARQILLGHYGINPGEFAAPSSSILWPFLLAPLSFTRLYEFLPLAIDLGAVVVSVWWLGRWLEGYMSPWWALVVTLFAAFALNFYGLALTGMENSVQVALTIVVAVSLVEGRLHWPFWCAIVLLPFVRYEGLAISLPALLYLLFSEHRGKAIFCAIVIAGGVGGFSLFLYGHGAGLLPASVLAKNGLRMMQEVRGWDAILDNVEQQAVFVVLAVFAALLLLRVGMPGAALLLVLVPTMLHLMFGKYGWFARYHIYFAAWVSIFFLGAYMRAELLRPLLFNIVLLGAFAWASLDPMIATLTTASGSRNIADQQKQMATIARDYLDEPVAVNDLGFVSYYSRRYVLDLVGLASLEALHAQAEDPATDVWVPRLMAAHQVEQAMIFDGWLKKRPPAWIKVATLILPLPWISVGDDHVSLYSVTPAAAERLRKALANYRQSSRQAAMMLVLEPL
ncbi:MAG: hypothetical protein JOY81_03880 [Alphaproteobacteria bacterium]|nr:hypothetical protein [Alphaproteobacteria bacterium]